MGEEAAFDVSRLVFWVMILGIVIAAAGTAIQFGRRVDGKDELGFLNYLRPVNDTRTGLLVGFI